MALNSKIKLNTATLLILLIISGLFFIGQSGFKVLSGMRAYVGAEALWTKGQKEATYQLIQYVFTGEDHRYQAFVDSLKVPLGDRAARQELEQSDPVDDIIFQGFSDGGNHPKDIPTMIFLYKYFKNIGSVKKAVDQWEIADSLIQALLQLGSQTHGRLTQKAFSAEQRLLILSEIDDLQKQLNAAETQFSFHMSEAARQTAGLLFWIMLGFTLVGGILCFFMLRLIAGIISDLDKNNRQLEYQAEQEYILKTELRQSEELYRSLVDNINMGITLIDQNHQVIMVNAAQKKLIKKESRELIGKKCFEEFENRDHICPHCPGILAMETGRPQEAITHGKRRDGSLYTFLLRAFPVIRNNGQQPDAFIEVIENITEKIATQQALIAEKERLAVTLRSIGDGVITTDINGTVVLLNKVAEMLTGWTHAEAVGQPLEKVFHIINEHTRQICENPVTKVISSGQIIGLANHTVLVAKDGSERSIADSGAPIFDDHSDIIGVVLVFRDVTEQIKTEQELLKIKKLESIGVLAGGIAHDFNNILAAIMGNINMAIYDDTLKEETKKRLTEAEKAILRAKGLAQQLLTFARGGNPVKEVTSIQDIIKDSADFVLHGDTVACRYNMPEDLWLVDIDKGQMSQVIQNIVINASHAMPEGGTITITGENMHLLNDAAPVFVKSERVVKITIQDTGPGIDSTMQEKIFDPYFTTKQEGSGLGLAICQSIVSKHDGHISIESSPGQGSTFSILLPASEKIEPAKKRISGKATPSKPAKILIMDDEEMIRNITQALLSKMGHNIVPAADGFEAFTLYQSAMTSGKPFDIVIMDLTVPGGMGGKEATQAIIDIDPKAKVIVSSGYSTDPIMMDYKAYGFSAAIEKPYQFEELSKIISQHLD
ncbi:MAG: PAS domain S-box protein [Pseudomonadota bacterium]